MSQSHGSGWVSHRFMCLTVMDLDGSLINSCVSKLWIWMGLFWIHVSHSHGFGWVSHRFMCLTVMDLDGSLIDSCVSKSWIWMGLL